MSSTATLTTGEESSSSLRTTPENGDTEEDLTKHQDEMTAQVSKQIESEAAQVQNTGAADNEQTTSTTRRRSMRIKSKGTQPATTAAAAAPITTTEPPITPHPRSKVPQDTPTTSSDATITTRSLRSSLRKPKEEPETDSSRATPLPEATRE
jgi:hypothetical protein